MVNYIRYTKHQISNCPSIRTAAVKFKTWNFDFEIIS